MDTGPSGGSTQNTLRFWLEFTTAASAQLTTPLLLFFHSSSSREMWNFHFDLKGQ